MVGDAVENGCGHFGITEDADPFGKATIGGDENGSFFVELADVATKQLLCAVMKQQCVTRGREREVAEFIDDDGVALTELFGQTSNSSLSLFAIQQVDQINAL